MEAFYRNQNRRIEVSGDVVLHHAGDAVKRFVFGDKVRPVRVGEVAGD